MKFLTASALSCFITSVIAADCFGQPQTDLAKTYGDAYWDARQKMCSTSASGGGSCEYQKDCTTSSSKTVHGFITLTDNVEFKRWKAGGSGGFKDCWDATDRDIINQCVVGSGQMGGTWVANGQVYQLNSWWSN
ncbi:uncharacterized protein N7496_003851 [Penicillium cataractarum]|uniref:Uncharacterized protein n=1 Tax=Penicillium cataractarum TaxID=2100454 RepID=A0A9W9SMV6_9EURO|nr:uncharacterized protein N7496_003851 [Penicillium cataractarum]KAJ5381423.1 hypothetical protein N7496_003851 [Penicillium cataractarum]